MKKNKRKELNTSKIKMVLLVMIVVVFLIMMMFSRMKKNREIRKQSQKGVSMVELQEVPISMFQEVEANSLEKIPERESKFYLNNSGNIVIVRPDQKEYIVLVGGEVFEIGENKQWLVVNDEKTVTSVLIDSLLAIQTKKSLSEKYLNVILDSIKIFNLQENDIILISKAVNLDYRSLKEYVEKNSSYLLTSFLEKYGDINLERMEQKNLNVIARYLNVDLYDFEDYIEEGGSSLLEYLKSQKLDMNLKVLSSYELAEFSEAMKIDTELLMGIAMSGNSLLKYINGDIFDNEGDVEGDFDYDKERLEAISNILKMAGVEDSPQKILKKLDKDGISVNEWIQGILSKGLKKDDKTTVIFEKNPHESEHPEHEGENVNSSITKYSTNAKESGLYLQNDTSQSLEELLNTRYFEGPPESEYQVQNAQKSKNQFQDSNRRETKVVNSELKNNMLTAGTVINATLLTAVNSDLPGMLVAQVNQTVFDSFTLTNVLIPKGSRLIGQYDSNISFGQSRLLVSWNQIIRPDGVIIDINGYNGIETQGFTGYSGGVNNHTMQKVGTLLVYSAFSFGIEKVGKMFGDDEFTSQTYKTMQEPIQEMADRYIDRIINRQPTLTLPVGKKVTVLVNENVELPIYKKLR